MAVTTADELLDRIALEAKENTGELDLSGTNLDREVRLTKIPDDVFHLTHLRSLDISHQNIDSIPDDIVKLRNLASLKLNLNRLTSIPKCLSTLPELRVLDIGHNRFDKFPEAVLKLSTLESLDLSGHVGLGLPSEFQNLQQLGSLALFGTKLEQLPSWFGEITGLHTLYLDGNGFQSIPAAIFSLTALRILSLAGNPLHEVDPRLSALTELNILWLEDTGLSALPPELKKLTKLTNLYLHGRNRFAFIPEVIFELKALRTIDFSSRSDEHSNHISEVPRQIIELPRLVRLDLQGNPIQSPPAEIVFRGISAIREYFTQVSRSGEAFVFEAKLLIVGEPGAGKTSLMKKLVDPNYQLSDEEKSTEGIAISQWKFNAGDGQDFIANIWRFRWSRNLSHYASICSHQEVFIPLVGRRSQGRHRFLLLVTYY